MEKWLQIDWTPEAVSSYGIIFFIAFGSVALADQGWKIWKNRSGESVSIMWTCIFFFMFLAYPIIGVERQNNLILWQGVFRILFYIPILAALYKFEVFTKEDIVLARILFFMIFTMIEYPFTGEFIYSTLNLLGVVGVFRQGWIIKKKKKTGVVSAILLFAYAANATLWVKYTYERGDLFLFINSSLFVFSYAYAISMWIKFRLQEYRHAVV